MITFGEIQIKFIMLSFQRICVYFWGQQLDIFFKKFLAPKLTDQNQGPNGAEQVTLNYLYDLFIVEFGK